MDFKKSYSGLRIRIYDDHAEQTLKIPDPKMIQNKYHEVIEISDQLDLDEAKKIIEKAKAGQAIKFSGNIGSYLQKTYNSLQLFLFTWSQTKRMLENGPKDCELTLDQTKYPDQYIDYELEIENVNPQLIKEVLNILTKKYQLDLEAKNENNNKIQRAFSHRNKTN